MRKETDVAIYYFFNENGIRMGSTSRSSLEYAREVAVRLNEICALPELGNIEYITDHLSMSEANLFTAVKQEARVGKVFLIGTTGAGNDGKVLVLAGDETQAIAIARGHSKAFYRDENAWQAPTCREVSESGGYGVIFAFSRLSKKED